MFQRIISITYNLYSFLEYNFIRRKIFAGKIVFKKKNQKEMFYDFDQSWTIFLHIKFLYLDPKIIRVILIHRDLKLSLESFFSQNLL